MTPDQQAKMFDKFYRASKSQNWITGLGIGLSIVRSIVDGHRGDIEVESELGKGTCVRNRLPLAVV